MKIEIVEKWFELNETLTREQYETLGSMYDIILDIAIVEANNCKQITPIVSDQTKNDIGEVEKPSSEIPGVVKPNDIWTEDEDEIIKKYYPVMSAPAIKLEKLPHRSKQAIYDRAYFLKIKKSKHRKKEPVQKKEIMHPSDQTKKDIEDNNKFCPKCQTVKPIAEFHKNKCSNDGLQSYCITCKQGYGNYYLRKKQKSEKEPVRKKEITHPSDQTKKEKIVEIKPVDVEIKPVEKKDNDWSFEEENLLRDNFFKIGFEKLLKLLPGRSEESVQKKVKLMGMAL